MEKNDEKIAIIGLSGIFPKSANIEEYWENIFLGKDCITRLNEIKCRKLSLPDLVLNSELYVRAAGIMPKFKQNKSFKANISLSSETKSFADVITKSLYMANIYNYAGKDIGLFGTSINDNFDLKDNYSKLNNLTLSKIAYTLNLTGPCIFIDTACSSSLSSVIDASNYLKLRYCNIAISAASYKLRDSTKYYYNKSDSILSDSGVCSAFDINADGTVPGEGMASIVLKRLSDALNDKNKIYGIIAGYSLNNDGNDKIGFSSPSVTGQVTNINKAISNANINKQNIDYIECHGTGTPVGDYVELEALKEIFKKSKNKYYIGSVKSNIGHLNHVSGLASIIKVCGMFQASIIPPQIHFSKCNQNIGLDNSNFIISRKLKKWERFENQKTALISSLGIGGTNAHIILEDIKTPFNNAGKIKKYYSYTRIHSKKEIKLPNQVFLDIKNIWCKILNIEKSSIDNNADFMSLGGDSISYLEMLLEVKKCYSLNSTLYNKTKLADIVDIVYNGKSYKSSNIVCLKKGKNKKPLYLIHPIGGGVSCFQELADSIDNTVPVYALFDYGLSNTPSTIERIASLYYSNIIQHCGDTDFHLAGWSYGGNIAFEIAKQQVNTNPLKQIIMFDSWAIHLDIYNNKDSLHKIITNQVSNNSILMDDIFENHTIDSLVNLIYQRFYILKKYQYQYIDTKVILFKAAELLQHISSIEKQDNGWGKISNLTIHNVPGSHETMLSKRMLKYYINIINRFLNE